MSRLRQIVGLSFSLFAAGEALRGASPPAPGPLFPRPLHLTRSVDDPVGRKVVTVEEYYDGNRAITISANRVVIVDYGKEQVIEIDRDHARYSVSSFEEVAGARARLARSGAHVEASFRWMPGVASPIRVGDRDADEVSMTNGSLHRKIAFDRQVQLSAAAFAVIRRTAYPFRGTAAAPVIAAAAVRPSAAASTGGVDLVYALPLEESVETTAGGAAVVLHNRVTKVGEELPSIDAVEILRGAKLVPSHLIEEAGEAEKLDGLPRPPRAVSP